jgi:hypothetical protein
MSDDERDPVHDPVIERVAATLRAPVRVDPRFDARVAAAIQERRSPLARLVRWLTTPRPVTISPLAGLALAAGAIALAFLGGRAGYLRGTGGGRDVASVRRDSAQVVQFVFIAPAATSVAVAGDFNNWSTSATPMHRVSEGGAWLVTVPLRPGRYVYSFVVNGRQWTPDPLAPPALQDDYGMPNSVVTVANRST